MASSHARSNCGPCACSSWWNSVLLSAPGIDVSVEALGTRGAQLRRVELARPRSVIGRNTVEALQSGILYGFASQVDGIVGRMLAELGLDAGQATVVATGGLAPVVVEECASFTDHQPWLTLLGLELVFARNVCGAVTARGHRRRDR